MVALLRTDPSHDPSKKAEAVLDYVLQDEEKSAVTVPILESPLTAELHKQPIISHASHRTQLRLLCITKDISVLSSNSSLQMHFKNLHDVFDEIHIVALTVRGSDTQEVIRLGKNVWVYTTASSYWWRHAFVAQKIARKQLCFTDGFRPDIVVALDPFESGLAGLFIAQRYGRAFQVHISEDFFDPSFKYADLHGTWRLRIASFVLKRTQSVCTATTALQTAVQKKWKHLKEVLILPRQYDMDVQIVPDQAQQRVIKKFSFSILFIGPLDHTSTLFRALDAIAPLLHSKNIGLVVVGTGSAKAEFQKRADLLGITKQVIFESDGSKINRYLHASDLLLCTDTTEGSDELVIKAAAAGLPILAAETKLRADLFTDGESAFLVSPEDTIGFSQKLMKFLNTNSLRIEFAHSARDIVKTRLHTDPEVYKQAYQNCIESAF